MNSPKSLTSFYIFFAVITLTIMVSVFLYTKKFKKDKVKILGLFLNLNRSDCVIISSNLLCAIITLYCVFNIENFGLLYTAMLIVNSFVSIIFSFSFHIVLSETIYTSITILALTLLNMINTFLTSVNYDTMTYILSIVFSCAVVAFSCFASIRKLELTLRKNKFVRRNG
jgi:hypothetical protein